MESARKHKPTRSSPVVRKRAKELRGRQTSAEALLWEHLRDGQVNGLKFRRQHPIGRFITDFCCIRAKLVVEVDGAIHARQREYDCARTEVLEAYGYRVIRFTNDQIVNDLHSVLHKLRAITTIAPSPDGRERDVGP